LIAEALAWLEASALAADLRDSRWVYPFVNAGHILGVALLVGAIVPLDLRLLGCWRTLPIAGLWRVTTSTALGGLVLVATCGALLFIARATEYAASPFFLGKMGLLGAAVVNAMFARRRALRYFATSPAAEISPPPSLRNAAGFSLLAWVGVLCLGRLIGYS
jgi:hypothetical protein